MGMSAAYTGAGTDDAESIRTIHGTLELRLSRNSQTMMTACGRLSGNMCPRFSSIGGPSFLGLCSGCSRWWASSQQFLNYRHGFG
jgi:hypothetical protein